MTSFWSWWIILLTTACIALVTWVLFANRTSTLGSGKTTGHSYDGIEEYDNPLPGWWFQMFVATLLFGAGYLIYYPGMGSFPGIGGWTQVGQYEEEMQEAEQLYGPIYAKFSAMPIEEVAKDEQAVQMGQRIFANNCALCHGSDARGAFGFPNLTDGTWLYGGTAAAIKASVANGRKGQMPAWGAVIGDKGVTDVTAYVRALSGIEQTADATQLASGKKIFDATCAACHGANGEGNQALGAPNLADNNWLYGSSAARVAYTIRNGRNGVMPAWNDILGEDKVHLVTAYVYSLSNK
ncbi:cytochrome-c oxidase, cbb3-type subunit III [Aestuariirhabdus litorea]|uniref:Cbb3-type cytochrome c oxidase subunit n=1 Tax=Aestuariirhabdus litorea TaxID=2528527 RepID=A0A3P3VPD3_9GAMM|nr:cytochrome-c oxidase, cbb3-type subunit III [Aestuariirhabdus litorea]RRJ84460.1 cytochrome-c oxidase, cbb3-type subunit III [Aestuariirhabdus litorea]RWW97684.1 cytochrome-c oxidase, cbb3-type subunit III [Endozoicomonadaceae bacterium GTF-13]